MQFLEAELRRITQDVFRMFLAAEVTPAARPPAPDLAMRTFLSSVQIEGGWDGVVQLHGSERLAVRAGALMFGATEPQTTLEQAQDAFGELGNMIGGNAKALLPGTCRLSLPTVVVGTDYTVRVPSRTRVRTELFLACGEESFLVRLLERAGESR